MNSFSQEANYLEYSSYCLVKTNLTEDFYWIDFY